MFSPLHLHQGSKHQAVPFVTDIHVALRINLKIHWLFISLNQQVKVIICTSKTSNRLTGIMFTHVPQRMNPTDFCHYLTSHVASSFGLHFNIFVKRIPNLWVGVDYSNVLCRILREHKHKEKFCPFPYDFYCIVRWSPRDKCQSLKSIWHIGQNVYLHHVILKSPNILFPISLTLLKKWLWNYIYIFFGVTASAQWFVSRSKFDPLSLINFVRKGAAQLNHFIPNQITWGAKSEDPVNLENQLFRHHLAVSSFHGV